MRKPVALVTGASSGIGRAIAVGLAGRGATVIVNYRRNTRGARRTVALVQQAGGRAWAVQADVGDTAAVQRMFQRLLEREEHLDILVNNAGDPVAYETFERCPAGVLQRAVQVNLLGTMLCSQEAFRVMRKQRRGCIVNVTSIGGREGGSPGTLAYAAAKGGVETFTRGLARVAGPLGITVNAVAPGSIATGMQSRFLAPRQVARATGRTVMKRPGTAEEVSAAVLFLASEAASFITGQVLAVDGGRSLGA